MNQITDTSSFSLLAHEAGFDPIEERLRANVRSTIEAVFEEELASFLGRLGRGSSVRDTVDQCFCRAIGPKRKFLLDVRD